MIKADSIKNKRGIVTKIETESKGKFEHIMTEFCCLARNIYNDATESEKKIIREDWNTVIAPWVSQKEIKKKCMSMVDSLLDKIKDGGVLSKESEKKIDELIEMLETKIYEDFKSNKKDEEDEDADEDEDEDCEIEVRAMKIDADSDMGKLIKKLVGEMEDKD